jgi:histone deacetylase 1/2
MDNREKDLKLLGDEPEIVPQDSLSATMNKPVVGYYYCDDIGDYMMQDTTDPKYPENMHPMKPFRIRMTHELITSYELDDYMVDIDIPDNYLDEIDMSTFHSDDYIELLKNISPETQQDFKD